MAIQIGAKPESTFADPLGLLMDCHRRIERFLDQLLFVAESASGGPLDQQSREALDVALRYFRAAAPLHTADEEESLFPRMRQMGDEGVQAALDTVAALESDHREAEAAHAEVDALGSRWLAEGALAPADSERLIGLLRDLRATYRRHIAVEDTQVFPLAGRVLESGSLAQVGREMAERRGVDPESPLSRCEQRRTDRTGRPS